MAKRRVKKRTHVHPQGVAEAKSSAGNANRSPKSMVIRIGAGEVGPSVSQLVKDVRLMMEPDTASRLKERKANKLKDYLTMAGPLGVTHLLLFSRSSSGNTNLRIALTPRGPTLQFKVEHYSLCKDIAKALKHPRGGGKDHLAPPLLVMNNFAQASESTSNPIPKQLESLTTTIFQSFFPPISPQTTPLSSIKRIMLLNREKVSSPDDGTFVLNIRHYAITTKRTGVSRRIRRLNPNEQRLKDTKGKAIPNLGRLDDVADYLLDPTAGGFASASETELDTDAEVEVLESATWKVLGKKERQRAQDRGKASVSTSGGGGVEKRAVKLVELGPRMKLRLVKVEEGVCEGKVMWHEFVTKTKAEEKKMDQMWDERRKQKEQRRKEQKANVERKKQERQANKEKGEGGEEENDELMEDEWDSEDFDDDDELEELEE